MYTPTRNIHLCLYIRNLIIYTVVLLITAIIKKKSHSATLFSPREKHNLPNTTTTTLTTKTILARL